MTNTRGSMISTANCCYNGNISAMTWSNSGYDQLRGYKFTYDRMSRLRSAVYGERSDLSNKVNRFNESVDEYSRNGSIKHLVRRGKKNDGEYGKIDNLHAYYDGNQLQRVEDNAIKLLYNGSMDFKDSGDSEVEYTYNDNGALTSDKNRGIALIEYDNCNNPKRVQFTNGNVTEYIYTATGQKLRTIHRTATSNITVPMGTTHTLTQNETQSIDSTDYLLAGTYRLTNGMRSMYLFPGGYCNLNDPTVTNTGDPGTDSISYHYYNKDHLGNNREVINEQGHIEQVVHYYPFGTPFTDGSSTNIGLQPYLYGNKELDMMHGLNTYDFGARNYNPLLPMWDRMDRYCEKYYDVNPYMYCKDNPISYTDSNGDTIQVREFDNDKKAWVVYSYDIGNSQFVDANGNAYSGSNDIIIKTASALSTLCKGSAGKALVSFLSESSEKVLITQKDGRGNSEGGDSDGYKSYIYWNPDKDAMFGGGSFIALGHELAHSYDRINGTLDERTWFYSFENKKNILNAEKYAVHYENLIRAEHGVNLRTHYTKDENGRPYSGQVIKENNISIYFNSQGNHLPRYKRIKSGNYIY